MKDVLLQIGFSTINPIVNIGTGAARTKMAIHHRRIFPASTFSFQRVSWVTARIRQVVTWEHKQEL